jgi:phosphoheptose isomerase
LANRLCLRQRRAAIANHLTCDCSKGIATDTALRPRVVSLSATVELITAIANDVDYAEIFTHQLRNAARSGDVLITISSSGNSENIVRAGLGRDNAWKHAGRVFRGRSGDGG